MLTNSNTPLVRELYGSTRAINCKAAKREGHMDLIIRNYALDSILYLAYCQLPIKCLSGRCVYYLVVLFTLAIIPS